MRLCSVQVRVHQRILLYLVMVAKKYCYILFPQFSVKFQIFENTRHFLNPNFKPSQSCEDLMDLLISFLIFTKNIHSFFQLTEKIWG